MSKANPVLIKELRELLALAESGAITAAILVGIGENSAHHSFAAPKPTDLVELIGETGVCIAGLQANIIAQRMQQVHDRRTGVIGGSRLQA